jgi:hypothetical protein
MPSPPFVWPSVLTPPDEVAGVKDLNAHLMGLQYSVEAWEAALLLYQTALDPPAGISRSAASRWRFIACNECVLELYHLRARLEKTQSVQLGKCPSLRPSIDVTVLRGARKELDEHFPDIELLRHAVAHRGENEAHPNVHADNGMFALSGFREPDVFSIPYKGTLRRLSITNESLDKINSAVTRFFSAFAAASAELESQGHLE